MSLVRGKVLNIINNSLKSNPRVYLNVIRSSGKVFLPNPSFPVAFFSSDGKLPEWFKTSSVLRSSDLKAIAFTKPSTSSDESLQCRKQPDETRDEKFAKEEDKRVLKKIFRKVMYTLVAVGIAVTGLGIYLIIKLGKPELNEEGLPFRDEFSKMPYYQQVVFRGWRELTFYSYLLRKPKDVILLPDITDEHYFVHPRYTLVLELVDVLVYAEWTFKHGWRFKKRPGLANFLEELHELYEIVIYTTKEEKEFYSICEMIDPKNRISHKLSIKALDKLNRDLRKVIVVNWNLNGLKSHTENVFEIDPWNGNENDSFLIDLALFLKIIAESNVEDVREILRYYNEVERPLVDYRKKEKRKGSA